MKGQDCTVGETGMLRIWGGGTSEHKIPNFFYAIASLHLSPFSEYVFFNMENTQITKKTKTKNYTEIQLYYLKNKIVMYVLLTH